MKTNRQHQLAKTSFILFLFYIQNNNILYFYTNIRICQIFFVIILSLKTLIEILIYFSSSLKAYFISTYMIIIALYEYINIKMNTICFQLFVLFLSIRYSYNLHKSIKKKEESNFFLIIFLFFDISNRFHLSFFFLID